jgi:uncharacterized protein
MERSSVHRLLYGILALIAASASLAATATPANTMEEGLTALRNKDYARALELLRPLANAGNPLAQFDLGVLYDQGLGVEKDDQEALFWYTKSAAQGYANAQTNLGQMYCDGQGVPVDYNKAREWWSRAAQQGNLIAQNDLGSMYLKGQGVQKDYARAAAWYRRPAEQGDRQAENSLGMMYYMGWGVARDPAKGIAMLMKAAEQGSLQARQNVVGIMQAAAKSGNAEAMHNMGTLCIRGWAGQQKPEDCMNWYEQAAVRGVDAARNSLAEAYEQGLWGVPADMAKARYWRSQIGKPAQQQPVAPR